MLCRVCPHFEKGSNIFLAAYYSYTIAVNRLIAQHELYQWSHSKYLILLLWFCLSPTVRDQPHCQINKALPTCTYKGSPIAAPHPQLLDNTFTDELCYWLRSIAFVRQPLSRANVTWTVCETLRFSKLVEKALLYSFDCVLSAKISCAALHTPLSCFFLRYFSYKTRLSSSSSPSTDSIANCLTLHLLKIENRNTISIR
jgi:hypothetical protein